MKKIATVNKFYIYKLEPDEELEKGYKYGVVDQDSADREEYLIPADMDFYEKTQDAAIRRALLWS